MFKVGEKVKFKDRDKYGCIGRYLVEDDYGIAPEQIWHGSTIMEKNEGTIIEIVREGVYIVEYKAEQSRNERSLVRLGFKEEWLEPLEPKTAKEYNKMCYDKKGV